MKKLTLTLCLFLTTGLLFAQDEDHGNHMHENHAAMEDSTVVVNVLNDFRMAIINNEQEKASELLTDDARILESGGIETKEEYLSHHFHSDGKFLSAMEREVKSQKVKSNENTAWVSTVSHMQGTFNEKEVSVNSAELAVLVKTEGGWKISSVHWSSRSTE
jgi:hypothetical protein